MLVKMLLTSILQVIVVPLRVNTNKTLTIQQLKERAKVCLCVLIFESCFESMSCSL